MLNVNYKGNARCNGLVDGAPKLSSSPFRKMGVHHTGGGIISTKNDKHEFTDKYKPLFANIPSPSATSNLDHSRRLFSQRSNFSKSIESKVDQVKNESICNNLGKKTITAHARSRNGGSERANGSIKRQHDSKTGGDSSNLGTKHSIIGLNSKHRRHSGHQRQNDEHTTNFQNIQNVESVHFDVGSLSPPLYQKHWFSREVEILKSCEDLSARTARLDMTHLELRRQHAQMKHALKKLQIQKNDSDKFLNKIKTKMMQDVLERRKKVLLRRKNIAQHNLKVGNPQPAHLVSIPGSNPLPRNCTVCNGPSLPCAAYCANHIMSNTDQVLFDFCTAKFSDNTQCSKPVFDVIHELPLCGEHARKRDNYDKMCAEIKPKKSKETVQTKEKETQRKRAKPSAMIRPQRRSKKRKRSSNTDKNQSIDQSPIAINQLNQPDEIDDGLATVEHALVTQATRLLEETDFTTVLNQIPADEFNELFGDPRNGVYGEPSAEEAEELERALIAVDNDVKSLEKLSQTHALLDQFLSADDEVLVDVATDELPDVVFHTAYVAATPQ